jgi:hypothetical protein
MSERKHKTPPTRQAIVNAQRELIATLPQAVRDVPLHTCWACHYRIEVGSKRSLVRAHIVADGFGGTNLPENFLLLCEGCHLEQPDRVPHDIQIRWLRARSNSGRPVDPFAMASTEIAAELGLLDGKRIFERWLLTKGSEKNHEAFAKEIHSAYWSNGLASTHVSNFFANCSWSFIPAFQEWVAANREQLLETGEFQRRKESRDGVGEGVPRRC